MIKIRFFLIIASLALLAHTGACGGSASRADTPPPQSSVDIVIQGLVLDVEELAAQFQGINNCQDFNNLVAMIPESVQCAQGGSATVTVVSSSCSDGPPLMASVTFNRESNQCTFDEKSTTGVLTTTMTLHDTQITGTISAMDIVIIGIRFSFFDIRVPIDSNGMASGCTGNATAFDFPCTITSDCSSCPLET